MTTRRIAPTNQPESDAQPWERRDAVLIAIVGLLALTARVAFLAVAGREGFFLDLFLDSQYYAEIAVRIRAGHGAGDHPYLLSPLYPYFLSLFVDRAGSFDAAAVRTFQAVVDALSVACAAAIARLWRGRGAAIVTGVCLGLYGPMIDMTGAILVATTQTLTLTAGVLLLLISERSAERCAPLWTAAGVALGLSAALRPTGLLVVAACAVVFALRAWRDRVEGGARRKLTAAVMLVAGAACVVAPFTIRNIARGGEPVLLSANGGFNFYIGNNARATGVFHLPDAVDAVHDVVGKTFAERNADRPMTYREASAWWTARAVADIRVTPGKWLELVARKSALFLHPVEIPQLGASFDGHRRRAWPLRFPLDARVVLLLALFYPIAMRLGLRRGRAVFPWPALVAFIYAAGIVAFFVNARYRIPVMPIAIVTAAVTCDALAKALAPRASRTKTVSAVCVAIAVLAASEWLYRGPLAIADQGAAEDRHRGMTLYREGRFEEAVAAYRASLAVVDTAITRNNLANAFKRLGRWDEAREEYRRALALNPTDAITWYNLGNLRRDHDGDAAGAREAYERALRFAPDMPQAHFNLAGILAATGERAAARTHYQRFIDVTKPNDPLIAAAREAMSTWEAVASP